MLNSTEHKSQLLIKKLIYRQMKKFLASGLSDVVFIMLINVKMLPTIVGILTFMIRINFVLSWVEHGNSFITLGLGETRGGQRNALMTNKTLSRPPPKHPGRNYLDPTLKKSSLNMHALLSRKNKCLRLSIHIWSYSLYVSSKDIGEIMLLLRLDWRLSAQL